MTRIQREKRTVSAMIALYCRAHHSAGAALCEDCERLCDYALACLPDKQARRAPGDGQRRHGQLPLPNEYEWVAAYTEGGG
jgi:hypothetical protein